MTSGSSSISYTGGSVPNGILCSILIDIEAIALGIQTNTTVGLTATLGNSGTATASIEIITGIDWGVVGPADWFNPSNWVPNQVPGFNITTNINNGGISLVPEDSSQVEASNLNIGTNGGSSTLIFESDNSADINLFGTANIGVTLTGVAFSTGTL